MGKKSVYTILFCVFVINSVLIIPIYEIIAEKDSSISRVIQWCCAPDDILTYNDIWQWCCAPDEDDDYDYSHD